MNRQMRWIGGALALILSTAAYAQTAAPPTPLIRHTFEEGMGGWAAMGGKAKVSLTHEAAHVKEGQSALQFDYSLGKGEFDLLVLPTPNGILAKAKSLRFWVRTDHVAPLGVTLREHEGGNYVALFTVPKDTWQQVELAPSDFVLGEEKDDPKDPDGKLDLDTVESIGIVDIGTFFAQIEDTNFAKLFDVPLGAHTLYLDDFAVSETAAPGAVSTTSGEVTLDTFVHPQSMWLEVGGMKLSRATGKPLEGSGLQASYHQSPGTIAGLIRRVPRGKLAGMEKLSFDVASAKPAKLLVQVEEQDGGKYNTVVEVSGDSALKHVSVLFADLKAAIDSNDSNDRLDRELIKQVLIVDISGLVDMADQDNTLWLGNLRAAPAK